MTTARNRTYYDGDLRADLITATLDAVAQEGPGQVSLRGLARRVGVSHAAPRNHFADKQALFTAAAAQAHRLLGESMQQDLAQAADKDPRDRLLACGRGYLRFAREHPAHFAMMWQEDLQDRADPELAAASARTFGPLVELAGQVTGGVLTDVDPMRLALFAWTVVHGLADLSSRGALGDLPGAEDPTGRDEDFLELVAQIMRRASTD